MSYQSEYSYNFDYVLPKMQDDLKKQANAGAKKLVSGVFDENIGKPDDGSEDSFVPKKQVVSNEELARRQKEYDEIFGAYSGLRRAKAMQRGVKDFFNNGGFGKNANVTSPVDGLAVDIDAFRSKIGQLSQKDYEETFSKIFQSTAPFQSMTLKEYRKKKEQDPKFKVDIKLSQLDEMAEKDNESFHVYGGDKKTSPHIQRRNDELQYGKDAVRDLALNYANYLSNDAKIAQNQYSSLRSEENWVNGVSDWIANYIPGSTTRGDVESVIAGQKTNIETASTLARKEDLDAFYAKYGSPAVLPKNTATDKVMAYAESQMPANVISSAGEGVAQWDREQTAKIVNAWSNSEFGAIARGDWTGLWNMTKNGSLGKLAQGDFSGAMTQFGQENKNLGDAVGLGAVNDGYRKSSDALNKAVDDGDPNKLSAGERVAAVYEKAVDIQNEVYTPVGLATVVGAAKAIPAVGKVVVEGAEALASTVAPKSALLAATIKAAPETILAVGEVAGGTMMAAGASGIVGADTKEEVKDSTGTLVDGAIVYSLSRAGQKTLDAKNPDIVNGNGGPKNPTSPEPTDAFRAKVESDPNLADIAQQIKGKDITPDMVDGLRKSIAKVYHPDMPTGNKGIMQDYNNLLDGINGKGVAPTVSSSASTPAEPPVKPASNNAVTQPAVQTSTPQTVTAPEASTPRGNLVKETAEWLRWNDGVRQRAEDAFQTSKKALKKIMREGTPKEKVQAQTQYRAEQENIGAIRESFRADQNRVLQSVKNEIAKDPSLIAEGENPNIAAKNIVRDANVENSRIAKMLADAKNPPKSPELKKLDTAPSTHEVTPPEVEIELPEEFLKDDDFILSKEAPVAPESKVNIELPVPETPKMTAQNDLTLPKGKPVSDFEHYRGKIANAKYWQKQVEYSVENLKYMESRPQEFSPEAINDAKLQLQNARQTAEKFDADLRAFEQEHGIKLEPVPPEPEIELPEEFLEEGDFVLSQDPPTMPGGNVNIEPPMPEVEKLSTPPIKVEAPKQLEYKPDLKSIKDSYDSMLAKYIDMTKSEVPAVKPFDGVTVEPPVLPVQKVNIEPPETESGIVPFKGVATSNGNPVARTDEIVVSEPKVSPIPPEGTNRIPNDMPPPPLLEDIIDVDFVEIEPPTVDKYINVNDWLNPTEPSKISALAVVPFLGDDKAENVKKSEPIEETPLVVTKPVEQEDDINIFDDEPSDFDNYDSYLYSYEMNVRQKRHPVFVIPMQRNVSPKMLMDDRMMIFIMMQRMSQRQSVMYYPMQRFMPMPVRMPMCTCNMGFNSGMPQFMQMNPYMIGNHFGQRPVNMVQLMQTYINIMMNMLNQMIYMTLQMMGRRM